MGKTRNSQPVVRTREVKNALADAITRAVHWAPETLLVEFEGERRPHACRRLAIRVVEELDGDGWRQRRFPHRLLTLDEVIAEGMKGAGAPILASLASVRACNGKALDGVGAHLGEAVFAKMRKVDVGLERR